MLRLLTNAGTAREEEEAEADEDLERFHFDPATGKLADGPGADILSLQPAETFVDDEERRVYVRRCACCGEASGRFAEPVTTIYPGDDALASVAAQALLEALPEPASMGDRAAPMRGRNLLAFADSRQDAAFFAPFFERTSRDQAVRAAIVQVLEEADGEATDINRLGNDVWRRLRREGFALYDRHDPDPLNSGAAKDRLLQLVVAGVLLRKSFAAVAGVARLGGRRLRARRGYIRAPRPRLSQTQDHHRAAGAIPAGPHPTQPGNR